MAPFLHADAAAADWRVALRQACEELERQRTARRGEPAPTLGWCYATDDCADHAEAMLGELRRRWPGVAWTGAIGVGVAASGVEHVDVPAVSLMLAALPAGTFQVFSGARPLVLPAHSALVHADPRTPDLADLVAEMSERTGAGYLFGGLASAHDGRGLHIADAVVEGGLSGVGFTDAVGIVSRVTQGCQPIGPVRRVTGADGHVVLTLDGRPALDVLLADAGVDLQQPRRALARLKQVLVGLSDGGDAALAAAGAFGTDTRVRHLVGIDPGRGAVAIADEVADDMQLAFCQRDVDAARRDLVRICTEVREALEDGESGAVRQVAGALYVSCMGRGGAHFGAPSAELKVVRQALGDVPLAGFFAAGEIAHRHLYGYTGVLTVFTTEG